MKCKDISETVRKKRTNQVLEDAEKLLMVLGALTTLWFSFLKGHSLLQMHINILW